MQKLFEENCSRHSKFPRFAAFVMVGTAVCRLYLALIWYVYVASNKMSPDASSNEFVFVTPISAKLVQPASLHLRISYDTAVSLHSSCHLSRNFLCPFAGVISRLLSFGT